VRHSVLCTGDVNLMRVTDPAVPFSRAQGTLRSADLLFGNLECCLYEPPARRSLTDEGFYAQPAAGVALRNAGFHVVGNANNVNYGADAILASNAELDRLGIAHTGTGENAQRARAPAIVARNGVKYGFVQRTSVYWPTNHEAGEHTPGVAVVRGHTAYQVPIHKTRPDVPPGNRPGVPPEIITWADPAYLQQYREDVAALRQQADVVVASHHWGLFEDVLAYMTEIAHAAIDAGADVVVGHGPHYALPVELYKGKPIYYGLGSFSFHTGHGGRQHGDWVGMLARIDFEDRAVQRAAFQLVRHNDRNETILRSAAAEPEACGNIARRTLQLGTRFDIEGDDAVLKAA
jgi:poly-gamma-glutamate capsule biosynthesis protein CapA/YwtB (metallophosphatase superfamily)